MVLCTALGCGTLASCHGLLHIVRTPHGCLARVGLATYKQTMLSNSVRGLARRIYILMPAGVSWAWTPGSGRHNGIYSTQHHLSGALAVIGTWNCIQWNLRITDTTGTGCFVIYSECPLSSSTAEYIGTQFQHNILLFSIIEFNAHVHGVFAIVKYTCRGPSLEPLHLPLCSTHC